MKKKLWWLGGLALAIVAASAVVLWSGGLQRGLAAGKAGAAQEGEKAEKAAPLEFTAREIVLPRSTRL
ncbi:MAG: hypothetical protein IT500_13430 [Rubrivivax sp.]|nr:hypothetical protein [Rubrivivax sp.]